MARIMCFDSDATTASNGTTLAAGHGRRRGTTIAQAVGVLDRSLPIRLFAGEEEVRYVGWEFLLTGLNQGGATGQILDLNWFMEFYGDNPSLVNPPRNRSWPGLPTPLANVPWSQEVLVVNVGAGVVNMFPVVRQMLMQVRNDAAGAESLYPVLSVHAYWVRLGFYVDIAGSTNITAVQLANLRLRVYAHVGGHSEDEFTEDVGTRPYVYNAYK